MSRHIDVIATTISGSVRDWGKIKQIIPLFKKHGENDVTLFSVDSHLEARHKACEAIKAGSQILISAGGSGTFNAVLEGCHDAECDLADVRLGFLRKGSADLIGKVLGMPDEIEAAIDVFVNSIREDRVVPCDVLLVNNESGEGRPRRFVGYGGAELFGEIPYFTENRFIKYYKGILSQLFGDLGPFFVGTNLAIMRRFLTRRGGNKRHWEIIIDGETVSQGLFQAMVIVNGDLGPNLPFAKGVPLGSGDFYLFTFEDKGGLFVYRQLKHAWDASIMNDPVRWGFKSHCVKKSLILKAEDDDIFPLNVDGSTLDCRKSASIEVVGRIKLISK